MTDNQVQEDIIEVVLDNPPSPYRPHTDNPGISDAIESCKKEWLFNLLTYLGMTEQELMEYDSESTINKISELKIAVYNKSNNEVIVQQAGVDVGEWAEPDIIVFQESEHGLWLAHIRLRYWSASSIKQEDSN
jgi:hypothetical protein